MDPRVMTAMVEENCPFAGGSSMKVREVGDDGRVVMVLEDDPSNLNAFGLVHAGAICGLAETAGGMALFHHIEDPKEMVVLNTILNIRFMAMPRGELRCEGLVVHEEMAALVEQFRNTRRAEKAMNLKVLDSSGKMVADAQATFRMLSTPEELKAYFRRMG